MKVTTIYFRLPEAQTDLSLTQCSLSKFVARVLPKAYITAIQSIFLPLSL